MYNVAHNFAIATRVKLDVNKFFERNQFSAKHIEIGGRVLRQLAYKTADFFTLF
jgi:hypothetical protein